MSRIVITGAAGFIGSHLAEALLDRAMAVHFDWTREAAPRYVEAYRRAIALRRRVWTEAASAG